MCVRVGILTILLVCTVATVTQSQPKIAEKRNERLEYETELQRIKRDRPKEYENIRQVATLWIQLLLGRLGYGIGPYNGVLDEKTESALREYQKQRKLPITGDPLSFETFEQTDKDTNLLEYQPTSLPRLFVSLDSWKDGFVSAKGTWTLTNENMAWPEQTTHIECHRDKQTCVEATALLTGEGGKKTISVDIDNYAIEKWDEHEIVTKPKETEFGCVRYLRRFNRVQKSVTGLRSPIKTAEQCKGTEAKEMHITLTDGFKVFLELQQNSKKMFRELMRFSPEALESLRLPGK